MNIHLSKQQCKWRTSNVVLKIKPTLSCSQEARSNFSGAFFFAGTGDGTTGAGDDLLGVDVGLITVDLT